MMHMGGGARVGYGLKRSMRQDDKIKDHKLPKGIVKRIAGFAKPYRRSLALFLVLIVIDALVGAVNPLFTLPNAVITPHAAYYSEEAIRTVRDFAAREVVRVLTGQQAVSPVNAVEGFTMRQG